MKKILTFILALIIAIIIIFAIGKNVILKAAIEGGVKAATGLHLTIDSLKIDFINTMLEIKNLKLYNPKGFEEPVMCEIPEIYVDLESKDLWKGKIHVEEMTLNLKELTVIKNKDGQTNVNALKPIQEKKEEKEKPKEEKAKQKAEPVPLQIDVLNLKVGHAVYKDYTQPGGPAVKEYNVDLEEKYYNIKDLRVLVSLILAKTLMKTTISKMANVDLTDLKSIAKGQLPGGEAFQTSAEEVAKGIGEKFKSMF